MKHTKSKALKGLVIVLILTCTFLSGCNKENSSLQFSKTVDELINKIDNEESEVEYKDYLEITLKEPEILSDVSDGLDPDSNYVSENIIIKNISDSPLKIKCRAYIPKEIIKTFNPILTTFEPASEIVELEPQQNLDMAAAITMKKTDLMTEKEKEIFNKYTRVLYVEILINGKRCYVKKEI